VGSDEWMTNAPNKSPPVILQWSGFWARPRTALLGSARMASRLTNVNVLPPNHGCSRACRQLHPSTDLSRKNTREPKHQCE